MGAVFKSVIVLLVVCRGYGATYHVDYDSGSNANSGTSTSTPWKNCPGDPSATGTPAGVTLQAGDTVRFKGGVVYVNSQYIDLTRSGTAGNPIVFEGNADGAWGTGRAILDGNATCAWGFYSSATLSYVTIRGFEIRNSAAGDRKGIRLVGYPNTGILVEQCYVHDFGDWQQEVASVQGGGIMLTQPVNCLIRSNEVTRVGNTGIFTVGGTNNTIFANHVHDFVNWCIGASSETGNSLSGLNIISNRLHDFYQYDGGFRVRSDNRPHSNGIFVYRGSGGTVENTTISHNLLWNDYEFSNSDGSYMINTSVANNGIRIFNNVLINPHSYMAIGLRDDAGGAVYNNTVYAPRCTALLLGNTGGAFDVKNNIFVANQTIYYWTYPADDVFTADYNAFKYDNGSNFSKQDNPYSTKTWAAYRSAYPSRDANPSTRSAEIGFLSVAGYPTNCLAMDLRLAADSVYVNAGTPISGITNDFAGNPRGVLYEIGAYEYTASRMATTRAATVTTFRGQ